MSVEDFLKSTVANLNIEVGEITKLPDLQQVIEMDCLRYGLADILGYVLTGSAESVREDVLSAVEAGAMRCTAEYESRKLFRRLGVGGA